MLEKVMLASALLFAPVVNDETPVVEEPTTDETTTTEDEDFDWKAWLEQWFTPSQVATIMSWVAYIATIIGLVVKLKNLASSNSMTLENVKKTVEEELKANKIELSEEQKANMEAYLPKVMETCSNLKDVCIAIVKMLALSQKDDAESKLAILDLISKLGVIDKDITDEAIESVKTTETKKVEAKTKTIEQVDKIILDSKTTTDDGTSI